MAKEIPLTKEKVALVDDEDFDKISIFKWHCDAWGYAARDEYLGNKKRKRIYMHRFILDAPEGKYVDHINGDTLDNRRTNLRLASSTQNLANQRNRSNNKSGYKGVSWINREQKWYAYVRCNKKYYSLGYFDCKHEAARAYNSKALELFGEFARLNEINEEDD